MARGPTVAQKKALALKINNSVALRSLRVAKWHKHPGNGPGQISKTERTISSRAISASRKAYRNVRPLKYLKNRMLIDKIMNAWNWKHGRSRELAPEKKKLLRWYVRRRMLESKRRKELVRVARLTLAHGEELPPAFYKSPKLIKRIMAKPYKTPKRIREMMAIPLNPLPPTPVVISSGPTRTPRPLRKRPIVISSSPTRTPSPRPHGNLQFSPTFFTRTRSPSPLVLSRSPSPSPPAPKRKHRKTAAGFARELSMLV